MSKIGFIGLGNIGGAVSSNLLNAGFQVTGYDIRKNPEFESLGGTVAADLGEIAKCETIIQSLPNAAVLVSTIDELLPKIRQGQIIIDLSSYPLEVKAEQAARISTAGGIMLDCEVSGLPHQVANRSAVIFKSGDEAAANVCADIFDAITEKHVYIGPFGTAGKLKLIANTLVCVHDLIAAEAINMAGAIGLDKDVMVEIIGSSAAGSTTFSNKAPLMISREFDSGRGPFRHMFGYLERMQKLATDSGLPPEATPLLIETKRIFDLAKRENRHDQDIAAIIEVIEDLSLEDELT